MISLQCEIDQVASVEPLRIIGAVSAVRGLVVLIEDLPIPVGSLVSIHASNGVRRGEVVGFEHGKTIAMLYGQIAGVRQGDRVIGEHCSPTVSIGDGWRGRVINALGEPIDGGPNLFGGRPVALDPDPAGAMSRERISTALATGVRSIDSLLSIGRGQRVGVFAGPGLGKSTLLGSIARNTAADVNVIALIGERGREVRDFIETALGDEGLRRSVVIVSTSDESPLMRIRAMFVACACAEHFRDQGADVMLMMDSITRFAQAQRQVGLASGEPPATRGFTPSVFALLPRILERAGAMQGAGSITGIYAVLVEGEEITDPITDAVRGVLDGHIALSRDLAQRGHFPAIDVLRSVSRVADDVCDPMLIESRRRAIRIMADYEEVADLVQIGAYARGSSVASDIAIEMKPHIDHFLRQARDERCSPEDARQGLFEIVERAGAMEQSLRSARPSTPRNES